MASFPSSRMRVMPSGFSLREDPADLTRRCRTDPAVPLEQPEFCVLLIQCSSGEQKKVAAHTVEFQAPQSGAAKRQFDSADAIDHEVLARERSVCVAKIEWDDERVSIRDRRAQPEQQAVLFWIPREPFDVQCLVSDPLLDTLELRDISR